jgi:GntR family transcriptional regulator, transcriptional repressor for pyruvate dehydrogenase complex
MAREKDAPTLAPFPVERVLRPREQVERQLRQAILTGVLGQNERLPSETKLAEQFRVSRATIREALRGLAESGLITKTAGAAGGSFVEYVDHNAISALLVERLGSTLELGSLSYDEVAEFRNMLEIPSARLAAQRRSEEHLVALEEILNVERSVSVDDPRIGEFNANFHGIIAEASGNRVVSAFIRALHGVARPLAFIKTSPEVGRDAVRHHIQIVAAVRKQDADEAEQAMARHLEFLRKHAV